MLLLIAVLTAVHVLPAVFWAGTTFVLARTAGANAEKLAHPQIGAAGFAIVAGAVLWGVAIGPNSGGSVKILGLGALAAICAAALQLAALPAVRRLTPGPDAELSRQRIARNQRIAAGLLAITITCMVVFRYF